jgi:uncharacterized protein
MKVPLKVFALVLWSLNSGVVVADALEDGRAAVRRGDHANAMAIVKPLALQGNAAAQQFVGALLIDGGNGVAKDGNEAVKWLRLAADQGMLSAQVMLFAAYEQGKIVKPDPAEAMKWLRRAAIQGHTQSIVWLGDKHRYPEKGEPDYAEAAKWYRLAADKGNASAQANLGVMHKNGHGVTKDPQEAVRLLRLSARQGLPAAQLHLGLMYSADQGIVPNHVRSFMWLNAAAAGGNTLAAETLKDMMRNPDAAGIAASAKKMLEECQARKFEGCD